MKKIIALWFIVMFIGMNFYLSDVYAQATRSTANVPRPSTNIVPRQTPVTIPRQGVIDTRIPGVSQGILDRYDDSFTGEALTIYADSYEPTVLNTALIEQGNVPVYVFLKANTLGGLLGQNDATFEPLYGKPKIRYVQPIKFEPSQFVIKPVWLPPMQLQSLPLQLDVPRPSFDVENMGTLVLTLRQIPREADVPDSINLNVTVRSYFDTERTLSYGREQLVLDEVKSENEFKGRKGYTSPLLSTSYPFIIPGPINTALQNYLEDTFRTRGAVQAESFANHATANADDCFFAGQGCVQAVSVGSTEGSFQVYNGHLNKVGGLVKLRVGQESPPMLWQGASSYLSGSQIKLRLDQIVDPKAKRIKLVISDGVKTESKWYYEGDLLSEDSLWRIKSIETGTNKDFDQKSGEVKERIFQKVVLGLRERSEIAEVIRRYPTPVEAIWNTITFDLTRPLSEIAQDIFGGQTLTFEKTYNLGDTEVDLNTLKDPCGFKDSVDVSIKGKVNSYCNAIDEFRNIIKESSGIKDENNDLWNDRAYCKIGKTYRELADTLTDSTQIKSAKAIAIESYQLVQDQQVCFKENEEVLGTILSDLKFDLFRNVNYRGPRVKEIGKELFVKIEDVQGGKVEGGSGIEVLVDGQVKNLDLGSEVVNGAVISQVNSDNIEISLTRDELYESSQYIKYNLNGREIIFDLFINANIGNDRISLLSHGLDQSELKLNELKEIKGMYLTS